MSLTGKLQGIAARGYRLRWSVDPTNEPDYDRLTLALLDAKDSVVLSNSQRVKARGGVVTKESEESQRNALVTWAEEVTRTKPQDIAGSGQLAAGTEQSPEAAIPVAEAMPVAIAAAEGQEAKDG